MVGQLNDYGIEVEGDVVARMEYANGARGLFFATNDNWTNESVQIRVALEKAVFHIEDSTLYRIYPDASREVVVKAPVLEGSSSTTALPTARWWSGSAKPWKTIPTIHPCPGCGDGHAPDGDHFPLRQGRSPG